MQTKDKKADDNCQPDWNLLEGKSVTYLLVLELDRNVELTVGCKGTYAMQAGSYAYIGSAKRNAKHRLRRHWQGDGRLKWHIDYLRREARSTGLWVFDSTAIAECELASLIAGEQEIEIPVARFGASDCRCPAHLFFGAGVSKLLNRLQNLPGFFYTFPANGMKNKQ